MRRQRRRPVAAGGAVRALILALATAACGTGTEPILPSVPDVHPSFKANIPPPLPSGRLPDTAEPRRCAVDLEIDPAAPHFRGDVYIDVVLPRATSSVVLHAANLTINLAEIIGSTGRVRAETSFRKAAGADDEAEELVLLPLRELPAGEAVLHLEYEGTLSADLRGLYRVETGGHRYVLTQFEPTDARRMMPCFDEPDFKIPYSIRVTVPKGNLAVSNARERGKLESEDGTRSTFVFATTPPLPAYLLALAVGPFEVQEEASQPTTLRILASPGKAAHGRFALEVTGELLRLFRDYLARDFPFEKLDLVAVPGFAPGGMENGGLLTFPEELLLIDPQQDSAAARRSVTTLLAHELIHQWLGNLVTMRWWSDLWLYEGLATHFEAWAADQQLPTSYAELELLSSIGEVMERDALPSARAVRQPVTTASEAEHVFDGTAYVKSAAVLDMLRHWLGPEAFRVGLRTFVSAHEWRNAGSRDLLRALAAASQQPVEAVASSFLEQPGVPVVQAELSCEPGAPPRVELSQRRRLLTDEGAESASDTGFDVPVCVEYGARWRTSGRRACLLLQGRSGTFELEADRCPAWFNPNHQYRGYYRYRIGEDDLEALRDVTLRQDARAQIGFVSNLWSMVRAGDTSVDQLFETLARFQRVRHPQVVEQVVATLDGVSDTFVDDAMRGSFERYVDYLLLGRARRLGWDPRARDDRDDELLRRVVLSAMARLGGDRWLLEGAVRRSEAFLRRPASVDADTAAIALTMAARGGAPEVTASRLVDALERASSQPQRTAIARGLGSFHDAAEAERAFDVMLSPRWRAQDVLVLVREAASAAPSRAQLVRWLGDHLMQVADRFQTYAAVRILAVLGRLCDRASVEAAAATFQPLVAQLGRGERVLADALAQARQCARLRQQQSAATRSYLQKGRW